MWLSPTNRIGLLAHPKSSGRRWNTIVAAIRRPHAAAEARVADSLINETRRYEARHEEVVKARTSPEAMLGTERLEEELRAEMAAALGRMDGRLREKLKCVQEENNKVTEVLKRPTRDVAALIEVVRKFNLAQEAAYEARLDLIIQRQSAGFWMENHTVIMRRYPIPPKKRVRL